VAGGSVEGSGPESTRPSSSTAKGAGCVIPGNEGAVTGGGAVVVFDALVSPPRSWGVYSVVNDGCGAIERIKVW
jgi:hypothetical protein